MRKALRVTAIAVLGGYVALTAAGLYLLATAHREARERDLRQLDRAVAEAERIVRSFDDQIGSYYEGGEL